MSRTETLLQIEKLITQFYTNAKTYLNDGFVLFFFFYKIHHIVVRIAHCLLYP